MKHEWRLFHLQSRIKIKKHALYGLRRKKQDPKNFFLLYHQAPRADSEAGLRLQMALSSSQFRFPMWNNRLQLISMANFIIF